MIAAIGNSEYLGRRVAPLLREINRSDDPLILGTDHPREARSAEGPERIRIADRATVLANRNIETVYVSSATGRHFDDCRAVLAAGKHVLVEKPVCLTAAETRGLDQLARAVDRTVFECLSYPHHPSWTEFVARVRDEEWTDQVAVSAVFRIPQRDPADFRRHPRHGGAAADLGTYCVDALVRLGAVAEDLDIGKVSSADPDLDADSDSDGGAARTSRRIDGRIFTYTGSWAIGEGYTNSVVVEDPHRRTELLRAFSPPLDAPGRVAERRPGQAEPRIVETCEPANATRACLSAGMTHLRDPTTAGLVDFPAILRRVAALETII
ncbi:Gfo/Idh/MocA family protein [Streptomyces sp. NPDC051217]|uniref:Gfo/Idh/MocA family protein n=1 Tax=Streptomyces sp. NPDC051217 TaxID=3365644 RepID=UPI0037961E33